MPLQNMLGYLKNATNNAAIFMEVLDLFHNHWRKNRQVCTQYSCFIDILLSSFSLCV